MLRKLRQVKLTTTNKQNSPYENPINDRLPSPNLQSVFVGSSVVVLCCRVDDGSTRDRRVGFSRSDILFIKNRTETAQ